MRDALDELFMDKEKLVKLLNNTEFHGDIFVLDCVESTNLMAKKYAQAGKECLITAKVQTAGKGRFDRTFESKEGGLYMSLCVKASLSAQSNLFQETDDSNAYFRLGERMIQYPVQAGEAVRNALKFLYGKPFEIKLPNDILLEGKKVCGILMESVPHDEDYFLIFGIGVNVENLLSPELSFAANLAELTGKKIEKEIICAEIVRNLHKIL